MEAASAGRRKPNNNLFSTAEMVQMCVHECTRRGWITENATCLEPSSGDGIFFQQLQPVCKTCICLDIEPRHAECEQQDFLEYQPALTIDVVIGNPPFGLKNQLAVQFVNKAAAMCNRIAFILPKSFQRPSTIDLLDQHLWPVCVVELPSTKFRVAGTNKLKTVGCSLFLWEKRADRARPLFKTLVDIKKNPPFTVKTVEEAEYSLIHSGGGREESLSRENMQKEHRIC